MCFVFTYSLQVLLLGITQNQDLTMSKLSSKLSFNDIKKKYTGARVVYTKYGERHLWEGEIIKIYAKKGDRFDVRFDNGVVQSYRLDALIKTVKSWGEPSVYLKVLKFKGDNK